MTTRDVQIYGHVPEAQQARLLVLSDGEPLGYVIVAVENAQVSPAVAYDAAVFVAEQHSGKRGQRPARPSERVDAAHVTIVVCTRNRVDRLIDCLRSLADSDYTNFDVLVVDNAPQTRETRVALEQLARTDARFSYAVEPVAGLSVARNTGLRLARGPIVAFTDDDVQVSPRWVRRIALAFMDPDVTCVTGLVPSQQVATDYERFFERRYPAWWTRLDAHDYDPKKQQPDPLFPFNAGQFGTGANFAVERETALRIGGFDAALGAGTPTGGGEDLDYFCRSLLAGGVLRFEPAAVVWHAHRAQRTSFLTQIFRYGCGGSAYAAKLLRHRHTRRRVARMVPGAVWRLTSGMWGARHSTAGPGLPWLALTCELLGYGWGPVAYWRSALARHDKGERARQ